MDNNNNLGKLVGRIHRNKAGKISKYYVVASVKVFIAIPLQIFDAPSTKQEGFSSYIHYINVNGGFGVIVFREGNSAYDHHPIDTTGTGILTRLKK